MRAKFVNEKFEESTDPIKDLGIGEKSAIKYAINQFYKLDEKDKNLLDHTFYTFWMTNEYVISFLFKRDNKTKYSYFKKLAEESGLESYIYIDDNNRDSFPGTDEISWSIPEKYREHFEEINEENQQ